MGFNNKKIVLLDFNAFEVSSIVYYLEEMAKKGWILEKISSFYAKFKKDEPRNIKYNIDIVYGASIFQFLYEDESKENKDKQESKGWNFLCDFQKVQVFYKECENEEFVREPLDKIKVKQVFKYSLYEIITRIIPILFLALIQYSSLSSRRSFDVFVDNGEILGRILIIVLLIIYFIDLVRLFKFRISPNNISYSRTWIKFKSLIILALFLVLFIYLITSSIRLNSIDNRSGITVLLGSIVIGATLSFVYFLININKKNIKRNTIISSFLILIVTAVLIINNFILDNGSSNTNKSVNSKEYSLSLKDFNDELISDEDLFVDESSSFLASKIFYSAYGKNIKLSYELFESNHEWITKLNFDKMMKWFEKQDIKYNEIETNLPNDIKVLVNEKGNNYILVSSKKIIELIAVEDIEDKEDFFNTVYEKIFTI